MASPAISGTQYAILNGTLQAWGEEKAGTSGARLTTMWTSTPRAAANQPQDLRWHEYGIAILAMTGGTFALEEEYPVTAIYPGDMIPWTPAPSPSSRIPQNKGSSQGICGLHALQRGTGSPA